MLNNRLVILGVLPLTFLLAFLLGTAGFPRVALAQGDPPTVTGIVIDKTDKNAVVARDQAIAEAQKTAFEILAEKSMPPEAFKAYKIPDSKTISLLVEDFEIKNEQISSNRYVASFTVRFNSQIYSYISIPSGLGTVVAPPPSAPAPSTAAAATGTPAIPSGTTATPAAASAATPATPAVAAAPRNILVLPYLDAGKGKKVLWEDPNSWRDAWQDAGSSTPAKNLTITVPLGDLADVSSGDTDGVWKEDFGTVEKSRANYNATEAALVVAHQSGAGKGIDLYLYKDGKLDRLKSVSGAYNTPDSFKQAIPKVIAALQSPEPYKESGKAPAPKAQTAATMPPEGTAPATPETPSPVAEEKTPPAETPVAEGKVTVDAAMNFDSYAQWMDAQKRLAAVSPPLSIEIGSLTKDAVQLTLSYDGGLEALKAALAEKKLSISRPVIEVNDAALGGPPTQKTVDELKLLN